MGVIEEMVTRSVTNIIPGREKLLALLASRTPRNVYFGIDPTATHIHLGHAVPLRKLQTLSELGHRVTFLIGDFTALIGDSSDKESERPVLTSAQIEQNFQTYKAQAEKLLDFRSVTLRYNSEWLGKLTFADIVALSHHFSAGDFYSREIIRKRLTAGTHVGLHELLYPMMQGYDSYVLDTDIQVGGADQTFNMQAGRILQKALRRKESYILATEFLPGTDGRKMSKTWGNAIWLDDPPDDMFGKIMSLTDELIIPYFTHATNVSTDEVTSVQRRLSDGENPMLLKKELAVRVVAELHASEPAQQAKQNFERAYQKRDLTGVSIPALHLSSGATVHDALSVAPFLRSKSESKRLIAAGSVSVNDVRVTRANATDKLKHHDTIRVGKKFGKVELKK